MKAITVTLDEQELSIIFQGLGELPLKVSGPVFGKLQSQLTEKPANPVAETSHDQRKF